MPDGPRGPLLIELGAALALAAVPLWLFVGPVGPFRAPGLEGDGLYGQLFAGAIVRRWLLGESGPGVADVAENAGFWPVAPMGALLQAALPIDPAWALGLVVALGVWLAGYGPWRLARRALPDAPAWGALLGALAAQTSPVVLRAIPGVDVAALAVGPIALGLAYPRLAWVAGLWSLPGAAAFAVAGLVRRRLAWMIAGVPLLALALPASPLPGAMRNTPAQEPSAPAYVTDGGAVFPLPPEEQAPVRSAAALTRTGLWLPAEVSPQVRGNLFLGPPPTPGAGRRGEAGAEIPGMFGVGTPGGAAGGPLPGSLGGAGNPVPGGAGAPGTPIPEGQAPAGAGAGGAAPVDGGAPPVAAAPQVAAGGDPAAAGERPWIGALLVPLQRLHGGPAAVGGLLLLLAFAPAGRRWSRPEATARPSAMLLALGGLACLVGTTLAFGWQAAPGEAEHDAASTAGLRLLLDGAAVASLPGGGELAWAALVPAVGALGVAALAGARRIPLEGRIAVALLLAFGGIPLENPRLAAPVAALPPDPVRDALGHLSGARMVVFPAPQAPFLQGQRPLAATLWEAAATGQEVEVTSADVGAAAIVGTLSAVTGAPVDARAARTVWEARAEDPLRAARSAGWRYLLVDLEALPPLGRPRVDGWLAERAGMPVARDGSRLLYDLDSGPAGAVDESGAVRPQK